MGDPALVGGGHRWIGGGSRWCTWFLSGLKGERLWKIRMANTRSVSISGIISMAKPMAGAAVMGYCTSAESATLMNFMTSMAFISPISSDPVSPMNIFAG